MSSTYSSPIKRTGHAQHANRPAVNCVQTPSTTDSVVESVERATTSQDIGQALADAEPFELLRDKIQQLNERVAGFEDIESDLADVERRIEHVEDVDGVVWSLVENLYELEGRVDTVVQSRETADERIRTLEDELLAEKERSEDLEARLEAIEGLFSDRVLDKEHAHVRAQKDSARDVVSLGDVREMYIQDIDNAGHASEAIGRIEGLVVFVDHDGTGVVEEGDVVTVEIVDIRDSCAHAVLAEVSGDE